MAFIMDIGQLHAKHTSINTSKTLKFISIFVYLLFNLQGKVPLAAKISGKPHRKDQLQGFMPSLLMIGLLPPKKQFFLFQSAKVDI